MCQMLTGYLISLTSKKWRIFLWVFIAFNTIISLLDAAIIFPQCSPVELNWDHSIKGHCWSNTAINATGIAQGCKSLLVVGANGFMKKHETNSLTCESQQSRLPRTSFWPPCQYFSFGR